jgi:X-Pro dipeptidyl-peptidase (S15 family)
MPASASLQVSTNVTIPMRDGVRLYADVYRPDGPGPFPVLLQRTPYNKTPARAMLDPLKAAEQGFAVVIQDTRGRYTSEGEFYDSRQEPAMAVQGRASPSNGIERVTTSALERRSRSSSLSRSKASCRVRPRATTWAGT